MDNLLFQKFNEFNHDDPFFDSLKNDYIDFSHWLNRKSLSGDSAYVLYEESGCIEGFMYLKDHDDGEDISPKLPDGNLLKIGTFKFCSKQTLRGQRFLKKAFDRAISTKADYIYFTVFEKHSSLINLFQTYGFYKHGEKQTINGIEYVYLRNLKNINGDILLDYPFIMTKNANKYLLSIYPEYHTKLFPDSKLITDSPDIVQDVSHTNSIHKIYICGMRQVADLKRGDLLVIYRTGDGKGPAYYRAVATSIVVIESVTHISQFYSEDDFINRCRKFSIFNESELKGFYRKKNLPFVLRFTYNLALSKRLTRAK
ncbi:N-acetyltransferase [Limnobaculum xujianqingii]|uniref:N-acetyltransferase n=1 Tax=Limnobaculum xujianqingii TaxID=2738837 RepID=UPI00112B967E|nr:N-acetyltransferase [Limnobaculum xujianqingii]